MKVIAILENSVSVGGGFTQSLNAIIQMNNLSINAFEFAVVTTNKENLEVLKKLNLSCFYMKFNILDKIYSLLILSEIGFKLVSKLKLISSFEKKLKVNQCDLVYFLSPSSTMSVLQSLNFIATVWDSSHRDSPEFDEVRSHGEFKKREFIYKNYLQQAFLTLVDAELSKESLHSRYGIDKDKMLVMPFSPNPLLKKSNIKNNNKVLKKYNLKPGYLFYPAQFWSHKNHIRVLQALKILKEKNQNIQLVFSGGLQVNTNNYFNKIMKYINDSDLKKNISILGFVSSEDMSGLYSECVAVIFPSYLGPTNIPPLEAWTHKKPLLCSEIHSEQVGQAAILFDPDSSIDIAESILKLNDSLIVKNLLVKSNKQIKLIDKKRKNSELDLKKKLISFNLRLN